MSTKRNSSPAKRISKLLKTLQPPARIQILLAIGQAEACVCHLEALLGYRQAYISQHLMALRNAGLLETRREGRYIFYRLSNPQLLDLLRNIAAIAGVLSADFDECVPTAPQIDCCCPHCNENADLETPPLNE